LGFRPKSYEGDNGYAAMVAEVEVDQDTGKVSVERMVVSVDAGRSPTPMDSGIKRKAARYKG
jgi:CO/xanthine dehydrogenase Mo-binding subunit